MLWKFIHFHFVRSTSKGPRMTVLGGANTHFRSESDWQGLTSLRSSRPRNVFLFGLHGRKWSGLQESVMLMLRLSSWEQAPPPPNPQRKHDFWPTPMTAQPRRWQTSLPLWSFYSLISVVSIRLDVVVPTQRVVVFTARSSWQSRKHCGVCLRRLIAENNKHVQISQNQVDLFSRLVFEFAHRLQPTLGLTATPLPSMNQMLKIKVSPVCTTTSLAVAGM